MSRPAVLSPGRASLQLLEQLKSIQQEISATRLSGEPLSLEAAFSESLGLLSQVQQSGRKLIFIGNGGSAAMASHQAVDFWKNGEVEALAFNDASLLTCISNDFSYEEVFVKPIERFAREGDLLVAISSSGKSKNILNAVEAARRQGCRVIGLSGFDPHNPLRKKGEINFYVPSSSYGVVEVTHLSLLHAWLDGWIFLKKESGPQG